MTPSGARRAVAIGGGTGLPAVLGCLIDLGYETTAVVTMADDGGSSGALRRELGMLPPGDVRNCLVAMAEEPDGILARVFQYRFEGGEGLAGHALGNLILAALADISGGFPEAIATAERYLHARGHVLPSTLADVVLHGVDRTGTEVFGQARLASNPMPVETVFLEPSEPPAYLPAVEAIRSADVIVIGPGSLYTSVIPNFLTADIAASVRESSARRVYVCNVANMRGETLGLDAGDHVQALVDHGLEGAIDTVLVHAGSGSIGAEAVAYGANAAERIAAQGIHAVVADFADPDNPLRHSRVALFRVLGEVLA